MYVNKKIILMNKECYRRTSKKSDTDLIRAVTSPKGMNNASEVQSLSCWVLLLLLLLLLRLSLRADVFCSSSDSAVQCVFL
jgi:hypothetical protein